MAIQLEHHSVHVVKDTERKTLLVVDDEESLVDLLSDAFTFAGYDVLTARSGTEAIGQMRAHTPDLVILDVNLPDVNGYQVCQQIRADGVTAPVIFLTARDSRDDLRAGFFSGGDDYVSKPFSLEELRLRVDAVLRRSANTPEVQGIMTCGDVELNLSTYDASKAGRRLDLSPTEFRLLRFLMANKGNVVTKSEILEHVWQYDFGGEAQIVATYISYVRRKISGTPASPLIKTIRGVGYTLQEPIVR